MGELVGEELPRRGGGRSAEHRQGGRVGGNRVPLVVEKTVQQLSVGAGARSVPTKRDVRRAVLGRAGLGQSQDRRGRTGDGSSTAHHQTVASRFSISSIGRV